MSLPEPDRDADPHGERSALPSTVGPGTVFSLRRHPAPRWTLPTPRRGDRPPSLVQECGYRPTSAYSSPTSDADSGRSLPGFWAPSRTGPMAVRTSIWTG